MLGFVVGTICLVGLVKVLRGHGRRWGHRRGHRQWMVRRLFRYLDTTPGQEKAIDQSAEELEKAWSAMREEFYKTRVDLARAMRGEHLDSAAVREGFNRQDVALEELRRSVLHGMQRVHEALSADQRRQLADLIEFGPHRARCGGGHSHHLGHRGAVHL